MDTRKPSFALIRLKNYKTSPPEKWDRFVLPEATPGRSVTIGRELDCELRIEMIEVSRRHANLEFYLDHWHVTDLQVNRLFLFIYDLTAI